MGVLESIDETMLQQLVLKGLQAELKGAKKRVPSVNGAFQRKKETAPVVPSVEEFSDAEGVKKVRFSAEGRKTKSYPLVELEAGKALVEAGKCDEHGFVEVERTDKNGAGKTRPLHRDILSLI